MPARIALAHDDPEFLERASMALRLAGNEVLSFSGSMEALRALESAENVDLLITRVRFPEGTPHGVSLARLAKQHQPGINIIFTAREDMEEFIEGLGELIPHPVSIPDLVEVASQLLGPDVPPKSAS